VDVNERDDLVKFLGQVEEILHWVIHDGDSAVPDYLKQPLRDIWKITDGRFSNLSAEIASGEKDADLDGHGLSGPELQAKLIAFRAYYESWATLRDKRQSRGPGPPSWFRQLRFRFRRWLAGTSGRAVAR
jgi:hypothetical protein